MTISELVEFSRQHFIRHIDTEEQLRLFFGNYCVEEHAISPLRLPAYLDQYGIMEPDNLFDDDYDRFYIWYYINNIARIEKEAVTGSNSSDPASVGEEMQE